jgi:hypothetical protein
VTCAGRACSSSAAPEDGGAGHELDVLGFRATIAGPPDLVRAVAVLLPAPAPWTVGGGRPLPGVPFRLARIASTGAIRVSRDGVALGDFRGRDEALAYALWAVHSAAIDRLKSTHLLFHAGTVARDGAGYLLPAPAAYGKSTLVAGLLAAGFDYLGDDIAVVDPQRLTVLPYPKCLAIKAGARRVLAPLLPELRGAPRLRAAGETVWYLAPREEWWPRGPAGVRFVVLPRYQARARTVLTPVSRSAALGAMLEQSFGLGAHGGGGAAGIAGTVELLRRAECYALTVGSLGRAVRLLRELAAGRPATSADPAARTARPASQATWSG